MQRAAVLIAGSVVPGLEVLRGAERDLSTLADWLISDYGGAWEPEEITVLANPMRFQARAALSAIVGADYAFVSFSGHGGASDADFESLSVCLPDRELSALDLIPVVRKGVLLVDACRTIMGDVIEKGITVLGGVRETVDHQRATCRAIFDEQIRRCEEGVVALCSCSPDQGAGESPRGGFFTRGIVEEAENWIEEADSGQVLSVGAALQRAIPFVQRRNPPQLPEYFPGRRHHHFPFAVSP
jgi:hypothetical protein